jgi:hypothetical protein
VEREVGGMGGMGGQMRAVRWWVRGEGERGEGEADSDGETT